MSMYSDIPDHHSRLTGAWQTHGGGYWHDYKLATFWKRFAAAFIDLLCFFILTAILDKLINGIQYEWLSPDLLAMIAYQFMVCYDGGKISIGRYLCGLRVVMPMTDERSIWFTEPTTGRLLLRNLCHALDYLPFCIGFILMGSNPTRQTFADRITRVVVVDDRNVITVDRPGRPEL